MSPSVKISLRSALQVRAYVSSGCDRRAFEELEAAISKATRASMAKKRLAKPKREKKAAKRSRTAAVRKAVMVRANGRCECGCGFPFSETSFGAATMDHFEGRARSESVETCWGLRALCHTQKTVNHPGAAFWLRRFIEHCERYGYEAEASRAKARLAFVEARGGQ